MTPLYWRPSRVELLLIAVVALACLWATETFLSNRRQPYYREKMAAAALAQRAFETIKAERLRQGVSFDPEVDPSGSYLMGAGLTAVTTSNGSLTAKQTTINANFAAVLVHLLKRAGVTAGDNVAVAMSGSFPALNIATLAALDVLKARPLVIVGAASSQWGANDPNFVWLDMQRLLHDRGIFTSLPLAASRGGIEDRGVGMSPAGRALLDAAMARNAVLALQINSYGDSVEQRMTTYNEATEGGTIRAYVNVGGGTASVGTHVGKHVFKPGLNVNMPPGTPIIDSVMQRFAADGVPVIHLVNVVHLAHEYGLPVAPHAAPPVGDGKVFYSPAYNPYLAGAGICIILATMIGFIRMDLGVRVLQRVDNQR